jgi:hypothetical protein
MNQKRPTAIKGTMNHAKPSFSTEIRAGAIISLVQYLAPLRYKEAAQLVKAPLQAWSRVQDIFVASNLITASEHRNKSPTVVVQFVSLVAVQDNKTRMQPSAV